MTLEELQAGKVLSIDKPLEWTSFQVVNKMRWMIRKHFGIKKIKIGHAGTLDPLATGLLIVCVGKATKTISKYQGQEKEYTGTLVLGATTPSYDLETEIDQRYAWDGLTEDAIRKAAASLTGEIIQKPPIFSAIKKDGKRLYEHARAGRSVEVEGRRVLINSFELTRIELPEVDFRVVCSKGTYIRSLAHDLGQVLDNGAHLSRLRRVRIGEHLVSNAWDLDTFARKLQD
jgi:tRNA pseudouridine55 synthase